MREYCTCATSWDGFCQFHDQINSLKAEIERLHSEQTCEGDKPYICHALATVRSENEQLRQRVELLLGVIDTREARLVEAEALLVEGTRFPMLTGERADWLIRARDWLGPKRATVSGVLAND